MISYTRTKSDTIVKPGGPYMSECVTLNQEKAAARTGEVVKEKPEENLRATETADGMLKKRNDLYKYCEVTDTMWKQRLKFSQYLVRMDENRPIKTTFEHIVELKSTTKSSEMQNWMGWKQK